MGFFNEIAQAIPNEFSKLTPYLKYIPYVGQLAQVLGGIDAGATTYADISEAQGNKGKFDFPTVITALKEGIGTGMGTSTNPGKYGSQGNKLEKDWADYAGDVGNLVSGVGNKNPSGILGSVNTLYKDFTGENYGIDPRKGNTGQASTNSFIGGLDLSSLFGGKKQGQQEAEDDFYSQMMASFHKRQEGLKQQKVLEEVAEKLKRDKMKRMAFQSLPQQVQLGSSARA